jgi:putative transposase
MPWGLKRYHGAQCAHFITFSCYRRQQELGTPRKRDVFEAELERVRGWYGWYIYGYLVMPEHVHLLVSEPERTPLSVAMQMLKQVVSQKLRRPGLRRFWQVRYYDLPVWNERKFKQKLRYIHRNPVLRGLAKDPGDWKWSSYRHYVTGEPGVVAIESEITAAQRERRGVKPTLRQR